MSESASGKASSGRTSNGKKPPHQCFGCEKEYTRPHKRLVHMRDCCPEELSHCPTCNKGYTNYQGVKVHHSREHGESLAKTDIYCERCGDFYKRVYECLEQKYTHCDDCREIVKSERVSGEKNPQHGTGDIVEYECRHCGEHRKELKSSAGVGAFCDKECRDKHQRGEQHPMWNGGKEGYYGPLWETQREKALERDNYQCQSCGVSDENATIGLNVHHITEYKEFDKDENAHDLDNLVCLCISCHNKWEGIPVKPTLI